MKRKRSTLYSCDGKCGRSDLDIDCYSPAQYIAYRRTGKCILCAPGSTLVERTPRKTRVVKSNETPVELEWRDRISGLTWRDSWKTTGKSKKKGFRKLYTATGRRRVLKRINKTQLDARRGVVDMMDVEDYGVKDPDASDDEGDVVDEEVAAIISDAFSAPVELEEELIIYSAVTLEDDIDNAPPVPPRKKSNRKVRKCIVCQEDGPIMRYNTCVDCIDATRVF